MAEPIISPYGNWLLGPSNHILAEGQDLPLEGAIIWVAVPTKETLRVTAAVYVTKVSFHPQYQQDSVTAAADCNAPEWLVSHYIVTHKKSPVRCGLYKKSFDSLYIPVGNKCCSWQFDVITCPAYLPCRELRQVSTSSSHWCVHTSASCSPPMICTQPQCPTVGLFTTQ